MINLIWGAICVWVGAASLGWDPREERKERRGGERRGEERRSKRRKVKGGGGKLRGCWEAES